ncbi:hypothetical protein [Ornithobacterium rhinotracheale]|uniref:hypothetical protein n=1 Tax=Ornithobacterium rhinotracheale TaxID=28251 RepID=UPI003872CD06
MTKKAKKLLRKLHKELNNKETCNLYLVIENANTGALKPILCYTHKEPLAEGEKKAFAMKAKFITKAAIKPKVISQGYVYVPITPKE